MSSVPRDSFLHPIIFQFLPHSCSSWIWERRQISIGVCRTWTMYIHTYIQRYWRHWFHCCDLLDRDWPPADQTRPDRPTDWPCWRTIQTDVRLIPAAPSNLDILPSLVALCASRLSDRFQSQQLLRQDERQPKPGQQQQQQQQQQQLIIGVHLAILIVHDHGIFLWRWTAEPSLTLNECTREGLLSIYKKAIMLPYLSYIIRLHQLRIFWSRTRMIMMILTTTTTMTTSMTTSTEDVDCSFSTKTKLRVGICRNLDLRH